MDDILEEAKEHLKGFGHPREESQMLDSLIEKAGVQTHDLLKWVFAEHKGYVETRARAGLDILKANPTEGWLILEHLVSSDDPDDRDTALMVLEKSGDPHAAELARPLLEDSYPYLQLDAASFLRETFRAETITMLRKLLKHEKEWVRDAARKLLVEMNEDTKEEYD